MPAVAPFPLGAAPLAAWAADLLCGDPRRGHPVAAYGRAASRLEQAVYADSRPAGALFVALAVGLPALAARRLRGAAALAVVTWAALGGRSLAREARRIAALLDAGDAAAARAAIPALVGRDPERLDTAGLARAAVESVAENTADAVVGPLLWGTLAGPAGVVGYRCANTLDAMVGHRNARYARFGWAAARLDDTLTWPAARVTAALAAALSPLVGGRPRRAFAVWWRDARRHPSPNAGVCEAAFAGALGVRLGGVTAYPDRVEVRGPLGGGPDPAPADVRRAVRLSLVVGWVAAALAAAVRTAGTRR